jgi:glycosyltransferase involved in cell wall biosynthesis
VAQIQGAPALRVLAVHQGGGIGGAPVSLLQLLGAVRPLGIHGMAIFTEAGGILEHARVRGVEARVEPVGGAFFYSAHARLGGRTLARFARTFPEAVHRARQVLRRERPDTLHLNTSVLLAWAAAARREGVPVLWMVREVLGPHSGVRRWHASYIQRHARRVVAISESVRESLLDEVDAAVNVVHNAVDLTEFDPTLLVERHTIRRDLGLAEDDEVVMAIGAVQREKGHWLLLEALARLASARPRLRLALVCQGVPESYAFSWRGRVKRALSLPYDNLDALMRNADARGLRSRVLVTGFRSDVARVLAAADVVTFPSLLPEGFGRPLIEAMAMQRPVVATHVGPSAEILGLGAGLLTQPDPVELARALDRLLSDADLRARFGTAGRARVEQHFSLAQQARVMAGLYRETAGSAWP